MSKIINSLIFLIGLVPLNQTTISKKTNGIILNNKRSGAFINLII